MTIKPVSQIAVADTATTILSGLNELHRNGKDGRDVAIGTLSAIRLFTLKNVGVEGYTKAISELADWLMKGE